MGGGALASASPRLRHSLGRRPPEQPAPALRAASAQRPVSPHLCLRAAKSYTVGEEDRTWLGVGYQLWR